VNFIPRAASFFHIGRPVALVEWRDLFGKRHRGVLPTHIVDQKDHDIWFGSQARCGSENKGGDCEAKMANIHFRRLASNRWQTKAGFAGAVGLLFVVFTGSGDAETS
jgi:hypothetical protein